MHGVPEHVLLRHLLAESGGSRLEAPRAEPGSAARACTAGSPPVSSISRSRRFRPGTIRVLRCGPSSSPTGRCSRRGWPSSRPCRRPRSSPSAAPRVKYHVIFVCSMTGPVGAARPASSERLRAGIPAPQDTAVRPVPAVRPRRSPGLDRTPQAAAAGLTSPPRRTSLPHRRDPVRAPPPTRQNVLHPLHLHLRPQHIPEHLQL